MPLVVAHRGASAYAPENTLAAFDLACAQGADMLELDVQRSADGELVIFHDATTVRWDGRQRPISACSLAELRMLDIGGERVATLAEVCAFARQRGIALNVELKHPDPALAAPTAALLHTYGIAERTLVSSFYMAVLRALQQVAPDIQRGYLMGIETYRPNIRARELWPFLALRQVQASAWHPTYRLPQLRRVLPLVRRAGYAVNVWTVNDPALMRALVACGATGIITDRPDVARAALHEP